MGGNGTAQGDNFDKQAKQQADLARLQDFLLSDDSAPRATRSAHEMSVAELEALLAQKRLEEARRNHRRLLTRQPEVTENSDRSAKAVPAATRNTRPVIPALTNQPGGDKLSTTRFEPASLVAKRPGRIRKTKPVATQRADRGPGQWLNRLGYTLEVLVIVAVLAVLGNWGLEKAGISLNLFGPTTVADFAVAPSQPGGIVIKAQASGSIQLPPMPTIPATAANSTPVAPAPTATPAIGHVGSTLAVAPTPTPAIIQPVLQSVAQGAAPPPKPAKRLIIPRLGLNEPVVEVTVNLGAWQVADNAVGHNVGTAMPGQPGNMVLVGHRDIRGSIFLRLNEMQQGDEFSVVSDNGVFRYQVTSISEVDPTEVSVMNPTVDPTATLITCTPIGIASRRLIVKARLEQ